MTQRQHEAIYSTICPHCLGVQTASGSMSFDLDKLLGKAIENVSKGKPSKSQKQLADAFAVNYATSVQEGYKEDLFSVDWGSPDWEMIHHLQNNVYEFSHAKSYEQLKALTTALYDKEGNILPYKEFKAIAERINNEMAVRHLETERETALASAQEAAKELSFEANKDIYPNLMFETAGDGRVRPSHAKLDGVVRPMDDEFWKRNSPPLGWKCRCTKRQATGGRAITPLEKIAEPDDTPDMFKVNFAKEGMAFPPDHPYYDHLPEDIVAISKKGNPFTYKKVSKGKDGGYFYSSTLSKASPHEIEMGKILANNGRKVIYLPEIATDTEAQKALRDLVLPKSVAKTKKNVDATIDGIVYEFKRATKNTIEQRIAEAFEKCERLVIKTTGIERRYLLFKIEQFKTNNPKIKALEVIWIDDNDVVEVF